MPVSEAELASTPGRGRGEGLAAQTQRGSPGCVHSVLCADGGALRLRLVSPQTGNPAGRSRAHICVCAGSRAAQLHGGSWPERALHVWPLPQLRSQHPLGLPGTPAASAPAGTRACDGLSAPLPGVEGIDSGRGTQRTHPGGGPRLSHNPLLPLESRDQTSRSYAPSSRHDSPVTLQNNRCFLEEVPGSLGSGEGEVQPTSP